MDYFARHKDLMSNGIAAASSAVLLSLVHAYPAYWYVSLFALIPFLWRLCRISRSNSLLLAIVMASLFAFISAAIDSSFTLTIIVSRLVPFNIAFSVFALGVHKIRNYRTFDPLGIALMWLPIEFILVSFANLGFVFTISAPGSKIVVGFCSLFGMLLGAFVVVFINSLLLWFLEFVAEKISSTKHPQKNKSIDYYSRIRKFIVRDFSIYIFGPRAPPPERFR